MANIFYRKTSNSKSVQASYSWTHTNDLTKTNLNLNAIETTTISGKCFRDEDYVTTYSYELSYVNGDEKHLSYVYCGYVE